MERTVKVSAVSEVERRIDKATAKLFEGTEFDRRSRHAETDCVEQGGCCKGCGRPMNETEARIYRSF